KWAFAPIGMLEPGTFAGVSWLPWMISLPMSNLPVPAGTEYPSTRMRQSPDCGIVSRTSSNAVEPADDATRLYVAPFHRYRYRSMSIPCGNDSPIATSIRPAFEAENVSVYTSPFTIVRFDSKIGAETPNDRTLRPDRDRDEFALNIPFPVAFDVTTVQGVGATAKVPTSPLKRSDG